MSATNQYQLIWQVIILHSVCSSDLWRGLKTRPYPRFEVSDQSIIFLFVCLFRRAASSTTLSDLWMSLISFDRRVICSTSATIQGGLMSWSAVYRYVAIYMGTYG